MPYWLSAESHLISLQNFVYVDEIPDCTTVRVPKIQTIYGVVGILKLLAGQNLKLPHSISCEIVYNLCNVIDMCICITINLGEMVIYTVAMLLFSSKVLRKSKTLSICLQDHIY